MSVERRLPASSLLTCLGSRLPAVQLQAAWGSSQRQDAGTRTVSAAPNLREHGSESKERKYNSVQRVCSFSCTHKEPVIRTTCSRRLETPQPHPHPGWHIALQKQAPGREATHLGTRTAA